MHIHIQLKALRVDTTVDIDQSKIYLISAEMATQSSFIPLGLNAFKIINT